MQLKIGYKTYTISPVDLLQAGDEGSCDAIASLIKIDTSLPPDEKANTIIHESLHAIFHAYGIGFSDDDEEKVVNALANGILEVILRNPDFVKELSKILKEI